MDVMHTLKMETLHLIGDGLNAAMVNAEIAKAVQDCEQRPRLGKDRLVTIQLRIAPSDSRDDRLLVKMQAHAKLPAAETDACTMLLGLGQARFRANSSDVDQPALPLRDADDES